MWASWKQRMSVKSTKVSWFFIMEKILDAMMFGVVADEHMLMTVWQAWKITKQQSNMQDKALPTVHHRVNVCASIFPSNDCFDDKQA